MKYATILLTAALLAGCAPQQPAPAPQPYVPAALVNPPPPPIDVPSDPLLAVQPEVRKAYMSGRKAPLHHGIMTEFRYDPYTQTVVNCQSGGITEIDFAPDERILSADSGDSQNWQAKPAGNHLLIEPKPSIDPTDLVAITDKRAYHFRLQIHSPYMKEVSFWYPDDLTAAQAKRAAAIRKAAQQAADPIASKPLDFGYHITGPNYGWRPVQAFSDGQRFYVQFPDGISSDEMPVLYAKEGDQTSVVNYQIKGSYLVADQPLHEAVLSQGIGSNREVIEITGR